MIEERKVDNKILLFASQVYLIFYIYLFLQKEGSRF
jgi:hypothetical protein